MFPFLAITMFGRRLIVIKLSGQLIMQPSLLYNSEHVITSLPDTIIPVFRIRENNTERDEVCKKFCRAALQSPQQT